MEDGCGNSDNKTEVFEYPGKYFTDESDNETIDFFAPDELLDNSDSLGIFILDSDFEMKKKNRK